MSNFFGRQRGQPTRGGQAGNGLNRKIFKIAFGLATTPKLYVHRCCLYDYFNHIFGQIAIILDLAFKKVMYYKSLKQIGNVLK